MHKNIRRIADAREPMSAARNILLASSCAALLLCGLWAAVSSFAGPIGPIGLIDPINSAADEESVADDYLLTVGKSTSDSPVSPSLSLSLSPVASHVSLQRVIGFVLDETRKPVAGATVQIGPSLRKTESFFAKLLDSLREARETKTQVLQKQLMNELAWLESARRTTQTDQGGRFSLQIPPVSRFGYRISVTKQGLSPLELDPIALRQRIPMTLIMTDWGSLQGQVLDENGQPFSQFSVVVAKPHDEAAGWNVQVGRHVDGRFHVGQLERGSYVLYIKALGHARSRLGPFDILPGHKNAPITLRLKRGVAVIGRVIDASMGNPIARASIQVLLPPDPANPLAGIRFGERLVGIAKAEADQGGNFTLPRLHPGQYWLRATARGFSRLIKKDFVLALGNKPFALLQMQGLSKIYGTVENLDRKSRAWVALSSTEGEHRILAVDPRTGRYEATGLDAGEYFVELRIGNRGAGRHNSLALRNEYPDIYLRGDRAVRFDLVAPAKLRDIVHGNITLNEELGNNFIVRLRKPLTARQARNRFSELVRNGARLWFRIPSTRSRTTMTNADGNFSFEQVPAGEYWLEIAKRSPELTGFTILHRELVLVKGRGPTNLSLNINTGQLSYSLALHPERSVPRNMLLCLVLEKEVKGKDGPGSWLSLPSFQAVRIQGRTGVITHLPVGEYRYGTFSRQGRKRQGKVHVRKQGSRRKAKIILRVR